MSKTFLMAGAPVFFTSSRTECVMQPDQRGLGGDTVTSAAGYVRAGVHVGSDILLVAKELGMGARTLQRRITNEGGTSRQLLSAAQKEMVDEYLSRPSIEINEAAFLLSYDDPNSFYPAFKTWEGTTPSHSRSSKSKNGGRVRSLIPFQ
jgi:AraC-like DNA-binding protein